MVMCEPRRYETVAGNSSPEVRTDEIRRRASTGVAEAGELERLHQELGKSSGSGKEGRYFSLKPQKGEARSII